MCQPVHIHSLSPLPLVDAARAMVAVSASRSLRRQVPHVAVPFPESLASLRYLPFIGLSGNRLFGALPAVWGS